MDARIRRVREASNTRTKETTGMVATAGTQVNSRNISNSRNKSNSRGANNSRSASLNIHGGQWENTTDKKESQLKKRYQQ